MTYRYWVNGKGYYEFKTFKVYWAYRWHLAELNEANIVTERKGMNGEVTRTTEYKPGLYSNAYKR